MKRRKFLAFLGGAVASGPSAAKVAAEQASFTSLSLSSLGVSVGDIGAYSNTTSVSLSTYDGSKWAKDALTRLTGMSALERDRQRRGTHIAGLDPNISACRSMSLVTKIRLSKNLEFERFQREQKTYLEGVIAGWWS